MIVQINRIIYLFWIFCLPGYTVFSQNHSSRNNYTGDWETPSSWSPPWSSPRNNNLNSDITINGYITLNGSLSFSILPCNLIINDTLVINGDLTLGLLTNLTINGNGILIVRGNLTISEFSHIITNNYIIITGDLLKLISPNNGSFISNSNPVKVFIGGNISPTGITNHKSNFPALNCSSPTTIPYPDSKCSYGNMTDIINDPIYPFFQSTCTIAIPTITAGGPTTFCDGGSVTLTSSSGTSYLWSNGATTRSINITASGSYTVKVSNSGGCQSTSSSATVITVNALPATPTITAGGPTTFCTGGSVTLTSSPGTSYLWSNGATTSSITVTTSGSYSVRVTNGSGCQSVASVATIITVNSLPSTPTIAASGPKTFCSGGSVTLTSSAGSTYLWSTGATTQSINVTSSGSYTVRVTNANGCQSASAAATVVTVNALPGTPIVTASGPTTFCAGGSVTLTSSTGTSYLWSNAATSSSINVTASGSYTVQVKNASGCQSLPSAAITVTVNNLPTVPTITAAGPTTFCAGGSVTLTSSPGSSYLWSNGATTANISITTAGTYTVKVANASGCQSASSLPKIVTVNSLPAIPTITAGGPTTFCAGGNVTLTSGIGSTYLWSNGATTRSINVTAAGNYTVQITNANGCQSAVSAATVVTVNAAPVVNAGPDLTIPNGTSTTINATVTGTGPFTYSWSPSSQLINASIIDPTTVNLATTTFFTLTATSLTTTCSNTDAVTVNISGGPLNSSPTATPLIICAGTSVQLRALASGGSGSYTYTWTSTPGGFTSSLADPIANPTVTTTYHIAVYDGFTTVNQQVTVTVNALPARPDITAGGPTTFCSGGSVTLTSSAGTSYLWSNGATTQSINITAAGSYTVQVANASGCQSAASAATVVTVNASPVTPSITANGPTTFCTGGIVTLSSSPETSYLWSNGATTPSVNITTSGNYTVQVTNTNGCQSAPSAVTAVTVNTLPLTPTITAGGPTTFCDGGNVTLTSSAGTSYLWSNGAASSNINITKSGSYTVQVTNTNGCQSAPSAVTVVTVNALPATPTISSVGPTTFCDGGNVTLTSSTEASYLWSNSATSPSINVTTAGSYTVQVINASGCQSAPSVATIVTVNALPGIPTVTAEGPTTICEGDTVILTSSTGISYLWSSGETLQSIPVYTSGSYTVKVTNASGCLSAASGSVTIVVNTLPEVSTGSNGPVCSGSALRLTGGPAGMTVYYWSGPGEFTSLLQNPSVSDSATLDMTGTYTLVVANANGCTNTAKQNIVVNPTPIAVAGPDQEIKFNFETQMNAELSASETGEWSLISGSGHISDIHSPTTSVNKLSIGENKFLWKVLNGNCEDTAEVKITVYDLFVPSVITPNGDGKNDNFKISEFSGKVELIIFNRWGNEEYTSGSYLNDWDGRNNKGVELPNDTYFYILKFENGRVLKGSVLIKR